MAKRRIMIVEDDEDFQMLYGLHLQGQDFDILRAYNGQEAMGLLDKEKPDLIILDMIMPIMDGEEFLKRLRNEKKILDIPVIIASVNDNIPQRLFELGNVHTSLRKPFSMDQLLDAVQSAFLSLGAGPHKE